VLGVLVVVALTGCDKKPEPPKPVIWSADATLPNGDAPDAATLARARDIVAARLQVGHALPPTEVTTGDDGRLRIRLAHDDKVGWEVAQRLRPGRVLLRPVRRQSVEKPELSDVPLTDQPDPEALAAMPPAKQYAASTPTCGALLVRDPADTADPAGPIAACSLSSSGTTLTSTKYLLDPAVAVERDITAIRCATGNDVTFSLTDAARATLRGAKGKVAVVLDGFVLATVKAGADPVTISGRLLTSQAAILCAPIAYAPLPVLLEPEFPH
jgi:hypothetical protein